MKSLLVAAVLVAGLLPLADEAVKLKVGDPAPDFEGKWVEHDSAEGKLSDLQGKYVLMEFWRTW